VSAGRYASASDNELVIRRGLEPREPSRAASDNVTEFLKTDLSSQLFSQSVGWACMHTCADTKECALRMGPGQSQSELRQA